MNTSNEKPNGLVINFNDTEKSKMLEIALKQIQTDMENQMGYERNELSEAE